MKQNRGNKPIGVIIDIYAEMSQGNCVATFIINSKNVIFFFFFYKIREQEVGWGWD
jgi:hypothetical protein